MVKCPDCLEEFSSSFGLTMHQSLGRCWAQQFLMEAELYSAQHPSPSMFIDQSSTGIDTCSEKERDDSHIPNHAIKNDAATTKAAVNLIKNNILHIQNHTATKINEKRDEKIIPSSEATRTMKQEAHQKKNSNKTTIMDVTQSFNKKAKSNINPTETFSKKNNHNTKNIHPHLYTHKSIRDDAVAMSNDDTPTCDDFISDSPPIVQRKIIEPNYYAFNPTPGAKAQIHLAKILSEHNCDLSLFDRITEWVKFYGNKPDFVWNGINWMSRRTLFSYMENNLRMKHLRPIDVDVFLESSNSKITVPTFDYTGMVTSMLHNPNMMQKKNIISDFNIINGTPTSQTTTYSDMHTGSLYGKAMLRYIVEPNDMPLPIYIFIDETHTDLHGSLKMAPVMFTFAFFSQEARNSPEFWRPLGFIPNLDFGKSKSSTELTIQKLRDLHKCIRVIFDSMISVHQNGGISTKIADPCNPASMCHVTLKGWVHCVIGDIKGNNQLCAHYQGTSCQRPYRDCKCTKEEMSDISCECVYVTRDEVKAAEQSDLCDAKGAMITISKYRIDNAFDHIPIADPTTGIYQITPPEVLHTFGNGLYAYFFQIIHDIFGINNSKKSKKEEIEILHNEVVFRSDRQSDRNFPRRSARNGPLDGTKMGATERRGNLFFFVITVLTTQGRALLEERLKDSNISYNFFVETLIICLSFEKWIHDIHEKNEVDDAKIWVDTLKFMILRYMDRETVSDQGDGWDIPKFHALSKFLYYIELLGCAAIFFGGPCECALKKIVKNPGQLTQRRVSSFASQVAKRNYEAMLLDNMYEQIRMDCGDARGEDFVFFDDDGNELDEGIFDIIDESKFRGTYWARIELDNDNSKVLRNQYKWNDPHKNAARYPINLDVLHIIHDHLRSNHGPVDIEGFTVLKKTKDQSTFIYRATELYRGSDWYDFCIVNYKGRNNEDLEYPAKILGFFKFLSGDIPSKLSMDEMYAVVQTSTTILDTETIDSEFVTMFELGITSQDFCIIPVEMIVSPLLAIKNYGYKSNDRCYLTAMPYRNWGNYFSTKMPIYCKEFRKARPNWHVFKKKIKNT